VPVAAEQAVKFLLHYGVAFTGFSFQSLTVEDADVTAPVSDAVLVLKLARRFAHSRPSRAEHDGDELMRQLQFGRMRPILTQQEPTCQPSVNRAGTLAGSRLRDLDDESLRVAQQCLTGSPAIEFYLTSTAGCLITAPYGRCARHRGR